MTNSEHLFISDLRKHPDAEVRLLVNRRLVSGTWPQQVTSSIDEMIREAKESAWKEGYTSGHSRAMRMMSDEPNVQQAVNPYAAGEA